MGFRLALLLLRKISVQPALRQEWNGDLSDAEKGIQAKIYLLIAAFA